MWCQGGLPGDAFTSGLKGAMQFPVFIPFQPQQDKRMKTSTENPDKTYSFLIFYANVLPLPFLTVLRAWGSLIPARTNPSAQNEQL